MITQVGAEHMARLVADAAAAAEPSCGATIVVAIDGPSGSGKTSLARSVAALLGAPVIAMDDLLPGWDGLAEAAGLLTEQVLKPLSRGEPAGYRRWDWHADAWAERVPVPLAPLLVVEGCTSSLLPAGRYAAVRVWVEAEAATRMRRGLERDGQAYRPHWQRWARQERSLFTADDTRERADLVFWAGDGPPDPTAVYE